MILTAIAGNAGKNKTSPFMLWATECTRLCQVLGSGENERIRVHLVKANVMGN